MSTVGAGSPLWIDAPAEIDRIVDAVVHITRRLRRRRLVLGLSGGIDSAVCAALAARSVGPERVLALLMPDRETSDDALELGSLVAAHYGIDTIVEDITPALHGLGCYERRDEAIRRAIPDYGPDWRSKLVLGSSTERDWFGVFSLVVQSPDGEQRSVRLRADAYLELVAAMNFKQRVRKMFEYHHADRIQGVVVGTPNRLEYDQGFFVKNGDGAADVKPIAHLYKSQVYLLAEKLGVPDPVRGRPPTTDTYSLPQSQEEFYFSLPYQQMDLCLFGHDHGWSAEAIACELGLEPRQVARVYRDIDAKRRATTYLHAAPQLVAPVPSVAAAAGTGGQR